MLRGRCMILFPLLGDRAQVVEDIAREGSQSQMSEAAASSLELIQLTTSNKVIRKDKRKRDAASAAQTDGQMSDAPALQGDVF